MSNYNPIVLEKIADKIIKITNLFYMCSKSSPDKVYFCYDCNEIRMLDKREFNCYIEYRLYTIKKYINENDYSFIHKPTYFREFIKTLKERTPSVDVKLSSKKRQEINNIFLGKPKLDCSNCPCKDDKEICNSKNYNILCVNCMNVN